MSNRLKNQSSPYLLQHAGNPVEWYPWCEEAFEKARQEDKPVFLSIGYSTCHWCHVMAHESFENKGIAKLLNRYFISIKVDREERPDIDSVYMAVCQAFTGRGGWPMSIFMTAEQKPFFAGTYFPPETKNGMIGFQELLLTVANRWKENKEALLTTAGDISTHLNAGEAVSEKEINLKLPEQAAKLFAESFDREYGGFGAAPKFPTPHNLFFLTLYSKMQHDAGALEEVERTLDAMRRGGIFDQIGYGFSRYSTDRYYLAPHFEKMLYDNALLIIAYLVAYKVTANERYAVVAKETTEYLFREMANGEGAFYAAQDADSEGEEGKFYTWDYGEIQKVLGENKGLEFCGYYGIMPQGNFEGKNIPNLLNGNDFTDRFREERKTLYQYRAIRGKLHLDDKILTSWNSLMISAIAMLYRSTGKKEYLMAAGRAVEFIEKNLANGKVLYVSWRDGRHSEKGFLDEYAYYIMALLSLYEVTSKNWYLERAEELLAEAEYQFADGSAGGYFLYGQQNENLIMRPKETYDGAMPSGNSVMAYCLVKLSKITGREDDRKKAEKQLAFMSGEAMHYPAGYSLFLTALLLYQLPEQKVTVVLGDEESVEDVVKKLPLTAQIAILEKETGEYKRLNGKTTFYVCENHTCFSPTNNWFCY